MLRTLSQTELQQITGRLRKDAQIRYLKERSIPHDTDADGNPVVLEAVILARHGLAPQNRPTEDRPKLHLPPR